MLERPFYLAICTRGHVCSEEVTDPRGYRGSTQTVALIDDWMEQFDIDKFCGQCGSPVITQCPECQSGIVRPRAIAGRGAAYPFCRKCGSPFPWATRQQRVEQLVSYLEREDLDPATQLAAAEAIAELAAPLDRDDEDVTTQRQVEAGKTLAKVAPKLWATAIPIVQSVLTAAAKSALGLP